MNVTVSQLNAYVKHMLAQDAVLSDISVSGEVSGLKYHSSGHIYFSLKDESAVIKCAFFKPYSLNVGFRLEDGMKLIARGRVALYERDGQYQLNVSSVKKDGVGDLFLKFEMLKAHLDKEGLFDNEHKRPLPAYPKKIGVVTSPTGAVWHDIMTVSLRRCPQIQLVLAPVKVQGDDAPRSICAGIECLNRIDDIDLIIVGRGGGSMEDLWCFNDESVARAIYASRLPIISAVGHETDFTIADFTADLRAATPSAAAELAVFDMLTVKERIADTGKRFNVGLDMLLKQKTAQLTMLLRGELFNAPRHILENAFQRLDNLDQTINNTVKIRLDTALSQLEASSHKLNALSPLAVLSRGFAVATGANGQRINSIQGMKTGDDISLMFSDGTAKANVAEIFENNTGGTK